LCTSIQYNIDEMQDNLKGIDGSLPGMSISKYVFLCKVEDAVSKLKPHENERSSELATDHFITVVCDCLSLVAFLLTTISVYINVPNSLRRSTIVPMPNGTTSISQIILTLGESL